MPTCLKRDKTCSLCEEGFCKGNYKQKCRYRLYIKKSSLFEYIKQICVFLTLEERQEFIKEIRERINENS